MSFYVSLCICVSVSVCLFVFVCVTVFVADDGTSIKALFLNLFITRIEVFLVSTTTAGSVVAKLSNCWKLAQFGTYTCNVISER